LLPLFYVLLQSRLLYQKLFVKYQFTEKGKIPQVNNTGSLRRSSLNIKMALQLSTIEV